MCDKNQLRHEARVEHAMDTRGYPEDKAERFVRQEERSSSSSQRTTPSSSAPSQPATFCHSGSKVMVVSRASSRTSVRW